MPPAPWRIAIDTGGTFTDAVALAPDGSVRTAKALSSGALRAEVEAVLDAGALRLRQRWGGSGGSEAPRAPTPPDGFVDGAALRFGAAPDIWRIERFERAGSTIRLDRPIDPALAAPGAPVEIRTGEDAPALIIRLLTATPAGDAPPPCAVRLSTTRATNALLQRRGARVGVVLPAGHADLLAIGDQRRPDLFAITIRKPEPWHIATAEVSARLDATGAELVALDPDEVRRAGRRLLDAGAESVAIALLHADINPAHEIAIERLLAEMGFTRIIRSSALAPRLGLLARAQTATIDAYIGPVLQAYLGALGSAPGSPPLRGGSVQHPLRGGTSHDGAAPHPSLRIMTSAGGLALPQRFHATEGLLSGPAGGVAGALAAGRAEGETRLISFDMGGTSTDVARIDDGFEYRFEQRIEGATVLAPAIAIETVAAGGGSICALQHGRLAVGPQSAGADPGPACYGAGGPLTLTDVNLLLGRIDPASLPIPIDPGAAEQRLAELMAEIERESGSRPQRRPLLQGLIDIADERMAGAIRAVSSRRGVDPADYTLVAFGGAGGLHACGVASRLGISRIIIPPGAGLLSAIGVAGAVVEEFAERQILRPLPEAAADLGAVAAELGAEATAALGPEVNARVRRRLISLRLRGQESTIDLDWPQGAPAPALADRFARAHERLYGVEADRARIEVVSLRIIVEDPDSPWPLAAPGGPALRAGSLGTPPLRGGSKAPATNRLDHHQRHAIPPGATLSGPALILEPTATTWLPPGWSLGASANGALLLTRATDVRSATSVLESNDAHADDRVRQELFTTRLEAIADDMGETLRRCALSTNIRQRLDYSCAILDGAAELIISAPHVPVHLGALGECVRRVRAHLDIAPGDIIITNHPAYGGSHLPDITLIAGVFAGEESSKLKAESPNPEWAAPDLSSQLSAFSSPRPVAFIACRAHHAEIGGVAPGSMPAAATRLAEEGVIIEPTHLVRAGKPDWEAVRALLEGAEHPTRAIEENLADLRAQLASIRRGVEAVRALARATGPDAFARRAETIKATAERLLRSRLAQLPPVPREAQRTMDDGAIIRVRISPVPLTYSEVSAPTPSSSPGAIIDFTGSSPEHPGNLNATPAIVRSCLVYILRLLVDEPIPLNEGLLRAIDLRLPPGMLNPRFEPGREPAVAAGNVETSQAIADVLIDAFELGAASQGTMNNLAFGPIDAPPGDRSARTAGAPATGAPATPSFYETIGGGAGATRDAPGASAIHTHMTNTALTDPEVMERRYPVRIERMAIRRSSGGAGRHPGGDGAERHIRFLAPARLSLVTQRRAKGPPGAAGGAAGAPGAQWIERAGAPTQTREPLAAIAQTDAAPGDLLVIQTPGAGGWGAPDGAPGRCGKRRRPLTRPRAPRTPDATGSAQAAAPATRRASGRPAAATVA